VRSSEADLLIIPGLHGSGPDHWQSRWETKLPTMRRVEQVDFARPEVSAWRGRLIEEAERATRPIILVAHSCGVLAVAHAAPFLREGSLRGKVRGAFLVAPPSRAGLAPIATLDQVFFNLPDSPLPFKTLLVASRDDPYSSFVESEALARALGADLVDAGDSGHINVESGHGPWPEGLLRFAAFLKAL